MKVRFNTQIKRMLEEGYTYQQISAEVGCSESYPRAVKCGQRAPKDRKPWAEMQQTKYEPVTPANEERIARMHRAGLSLWEIKRMIPDAAGVLR